MKAEIKKKWIDALRSGKYQQGRATLRNNNNKYCCLGVLYDILPGSSWQCSGMGETCYQVKYKGDVEKYNLGHLALVDTELSEKETDNLVNMNDDGLSFDTIAQYIEEKL